MHHHRKVELTNICRRIFNQVPKEVKGNDSLAQLTLNRIQSITKNVDEQKYMVDCISVMIRGTDKQGIILANDKNIRK